MRQFGAWVIKGLARRKNRTISKVSKEEISGNVIGVLFVHWNAWRGNFVLDYPKCMSSMVGSILNAPSDYSNDLSHMGRMEWVESAECER